MGILMETEVNLGTSGYRVLYGAMGAPTEYYPDTLHTIAIKTRETEFGSIVEPIPITLKTLYQNRQVEEYARQYMISTYAEAPRMPVAQELRPSTSSYAPGTTVSPVKEEAKDGSKVHPPPKKKWIREYLEEPKSPVPVRVVALPPAPLCNGSSPPPVHFEPVTYDVTAPVAVFETTPVGVVDFAEHSRPRTTSLHGPPQIPSPPSVGSNGSSGSSNSAPRAGTREVHNKLEKNRRAHLKECFELLKRQLPATPDDKKTSNLSILGSAIRYIQVLRRKERECEHEMERLAREKIAAQQRLAALKRDVTRPVRNGVDDKMIEEKVNGQVLGILKSMSGSPPAPLSPPPKPLSVRSLPVQISPAPPQVVRTTYGARQNTLTLTTIAPADSATMHNGVHENGVATTLSTLVHPAHIHLPLSQVVGGGGLVVGGALRLLSAPALRVLHPPHNGVTTSENNRLPNENGIVSPPPVSEGVMVRALSPLVGPPHLLHPHALAHKMVETQVVKTGVSPLTVSAQYLSSALVKPVVVVSSAQSRPPA